MPEFRAVPVGFADRKRHRPPERSLIGQRVLITDACSAIGRAAADVLAAQGAQLLLVARGSDELIGACEEIRSDGGVADWNRCDISALGDVDQLVTWVLSEFGTVDVLINTAGRPLPRPLTQSLHRFRDYQHMMATNYFGPLRLTLGLLPAMLRSGSGHVVNVGPWHPNTGATPNFASYASAQAAWTTFGQCAHAELSPHGIQVTTVHYPTDTPEPIQTAHRIQTAIYTKTPRLEPRFTRTLYALAGVAPRSTARLMHAFGI